MLLKLSTQEQSLLLQAAREAIVFFLEEKGHPPKPDPIPETLQNPYGAFVTLKKMGVLRGCIGCVDARDPLYETVISSAIAAAFEDSRFPNVSPVEINEITIEISVLGNPAPADSWKEIQIGKHGFIISKHGRRALFLPEVAVDQGWDIETALSQLSIKAGLDRDDWREGATFEVFESIKFKED